MGKQPLQPLSKTRLFLAAELFQAAEVPTTEQVLEAQKLSSDHIRILSGQFREARASASDSR
jgi:hypothetical protein